VGRDRASTSGGYFGPVTAEVWKVLSRAWDEPFYLSSNYAREHAIATALAASIGWITNVTPDGLNYTRTWHVTLEGLNALRNRSNLTPKGTP